MSKEQKDSLKRETPFKEIKESIVPKISNSERPPKAPPSDHGNRPKG
jgi:hypothetical protein